MEFFLREKIQDMNLFQKNLVPKSKLFRSYSKILLEMELWKIKILSLSREFLIVNNLELEELSIAKVDCSNQLLILTMMKKIVGDVIDNENGEIC